MTNYTNEQIEALRERAHRLIPSGAHTYSRSDFTFSVNSPAFFVEGKGARCTDPGGRSYIDYGLALCSVTLGHAYPAVVEAIQRQLTLGNSFARPTLQEGELAEKLVDLIPSAEMVKFAKNGSDVTSAAVRLARAYTGRDHIVRIREQPFHSFNDWFIGSTSRAAGVPQSIRDLVLPVSYNDIAELQTLFDRHPQEIAAVVMEPVSFAEPQNDYLQKVRDLCTQNGTVLVFDEIITGFRWHHQGAQTLFGVTPDLSTFGKGFANGFACAALIGKRELMEMGDMHGDVFLLSCTNGAELVGLTAASATLDVYASEPVVDHHWDYGSRLMTGLKQHLDAHGLSPWMTLRGYPCRPGLSAHDTEGNYSPEIATLFVQEMAKRGILMRDISICYSHGESELNETLAAADDAMAFLRPVLEESRVEEVLEGPAVLPVFTH